MKAYLAGPMRGYDHHNFPAFYEAAEKLRALGWDIVSPAEHDMDLGFDPSVGLEEQGFDMGASILWDLTQILIEVEAVILLPGWSASSGVALEVHAAEFMKKPVFFYDAARNVVSGYPLAGDKAKVPA